MFKERLRELRNNENISQKNLATKLGISQQLVASWETGRSTPDTDMLVQLAHCFNVTTDYLLGLSNFKKQNSLSSNINDLILETENLSLEGLEDIKKYAQLVKLKEVSEKTKDAARSLKQEKRG